MTVSSTHMTTLRCQVEQGENQPTTLLPTFLLLRQHTHACSMVSYRRRTARSRIRRVQFGREPSHCRIVGMTILRLFRGTRPSETWPYTAVFPTESLPLAQDLPMPIAEPSWKLKRMHPGLQVLQDWDDGEERLSGASHLWHNYRNP